MPPSTTIWSPACRPSAISYWSPDAVAQRHVPPREAAVGLGDVDERQVLVVAQDRRDRDQQSAALLRAPGCSTRTYICFFSRSARVVDDHAHRHRARVRIDQGGDVVDLAREGSASRCRSSTSRWVADADRGQVGAEDLRHHPDARQIGDGEAGRGAGLQQLPGRDQLFDHGAGDRRADDGRRRARSGGPPGCP